MALKDILKFQLKKVNPFQGLVIDADTWRDAHNYHHDQQRLHTLIFHNTGIIEGLEVTASNPPDLSINIHPGVAVDPEGNIIIVPQEQNYKIQTREKRLIHLIIQFREIPTEPYQPPEGGQPTRLIEAYRIQERDKLPDEPYLELARIDFDPAVETIKDSKPSGNPGKNEINLNFRQTASVIAPEKPVTVAEKTPPPQPTPAPVKEVPIVKAKEKINIGCMVLGEADKDLHINGLRNLIKAVNRQEEYELNLEENITLDKNVNKYTLIYMTGNGSFELNEEQQTALKGYLQSGGVIFGEGCSEGGEESPSKGSKEFGLAFNKLASGLNCKLEIVKRDNPLLSIDYVFSGVPDGAGQAMLLEGKGMIYSGSDYGCAWQGGYQEQPVSREVIRNSVEIGINIVSYAYGMKSKKR